MWFPLEGNMATMVTMGIMAATRGIEVQSC